MSASQPARRAGSWTGAVVAAAVFAALGWAVLTSGAAASARPVRVRPVRAATVPADPADPTPLRVQRGFVASAPLTPPSPLRVVALGDSVATGYGCSCEPFVQRYAAARAAQLGERPVAADLAADGYTSAQVRAQVASPGAATAVRDADVVVVMVGANDFVAPFTRARAHACAGPRCYRATAAALAANLAATLDRVKAVHRGRPVQLVVLGYWDVVKDGRVGRAAYGAAGLAESYRATTAANLTLQAVAEREGARYVSTRVVFRGPDGRADPTGLLAADGDHPNAAGQARIAAALLAD